MRWSWPAFSLGAAAGAAACIVLVSVREPVVVREVSRAGVACIDSPPPPAPDPPHRAVPVPSRAAAETPPETPAELDGDAPHAPDAAAEPADAGDPVAEAVTDLQSGSSISLEFVAATKCRTIQLVFNGDKITITDAPDGGVSPAATQGVARATRAAEETRASGRAPSAEDVDEMLASADDGDREAAIGLALRSEPPLLDRLIRTARDASIGGSLRATALLAAADAAAGDRDVAAAVVDLTADDNADVRRTAVELLPRIGGRGADRAIELLRSGDFDPSVLQPLVRTVAASERALDFLLSRPEPALSIAVLLAVPGTGPVDAAARGRLLARLPDVVLPLLPAPEATAHADAVLGLAASAGHAAFLRTVATTSTLPTAVRLAAVTAALGDDACAEGRTSLLAAALADGRSPVEFLRAVLDHVAAPHVADAAVRAALADLAASHSNSWLREEARAKLQASPPPGESGGLEIVSAIYGKDASTVDVTAVLRAMVVRGRLVVEAGNALAGDPYFGVVKDLSVVYAWRGERRTRTIAEYETLVLP